MRHKVRFDVEDFAFQELPGRYWIDLTAIVVENGCVDGTPDVIIDENDIRTLGRTNDDYESVPCEYTDELHAAVCAEIVRRFNNPEF